jgi:SsrA-binding protein
MTVGIKIIAKNRKASHDYHILETFEAGMVLTGTEVKSLRLGKVNINDGWIDILNGEAMLHEAHISPYSHGNIFNHEEKRLRKLLLKASQLRHIEHTVNTKTLTIIPLKIYFKGQFIKLEIALAKGKKLFDKRDSEKKKDADREMARALNSRK